MGVKFESRHIEKIGLDGISIDNSNIHGILFETTGMRKIKLNCYDQCGSLKIGEINIIYNVNNEKFLTRKCNISGTGSIKFKKIFDVPEMGEPKKFTISPCTKTLVSSMAFKADLGYKLEHSMRGVKSLTDCTTDNAIGYANAYKYSCISPNTSKDKEEEGRYRKPTKYSSSKNKDELLKSIHKSKMRRKKHTRIFLYRNNQNVTHSIKNQQKDRKKFRHGHYHGSCIRNVESSYNKNHLIEFRIKTKPLALVKSALHLSTKNLENILFTIDYRSLSNNLLEDIICNSNDFNASNTRKCAVLNGNEMRKTELNSFDQLGLPKIGELAVILNTCWREIGSEKYYALEKGNFKLRKMFAMLDMKKPEKPIMGSLINKAVMSRVIPKIGIRDKRVDYTSNSGSVIADCETSVHPMDNHISVSTGSTRPNSKNREENNANSKSVKCNSTESGSGTLLVSTTKSNNAIEECTSLGEKNEHLLKSTVQTKKDANHLLQGLLFISSMRNVNPIENGGYYLTCHGFWREDVISTKFCIDNNFNFLEVFSVVRNEDFLERIKNNYLILELWGKNVSTAQMVGVVRLPLHQFYIAFRDCSITQHLSQVKLPVISVDGWMSITKSFSSETCGELQVLLAIGTEAQLRNLKISHGLLSCRINENNCTVFKSDLSVDESVSKSIGKLNHRIACDAGNQTIFNENMAHIERRQRLSDLLGNFIENLAQQLPTECPQSTTLKPAPTMDRTYEEQCFKATQLRKTSDLLDTLQKTLIIPSLTSSSSETMQEEEHKEVSQNSLKILLQIESAMNLPRNPVNLSNKKLQKTNLNMGKYKQSRFPAHEAPSAYVTFQAKEGSECMVKSHEGMVYATSVIEKNCNPVWNSKFEIQVPVDLFKNSQKRFILKVWRKASTDIPESRLIPKPTEDSIIGFANIDLNVFFVQLPHISGWFNVVDFSGRNNGRIKVTIQPLQDISMVVHQRIREHTKNSELNFLPIDSNKSNLVEVESSNTTLSRAIKRKFTELEEITQRLKARLFDVTSEMNSTGQDITDEQLDEFERDLNTVCEDEDDIEKKHNFGWLGLLDQSNSLITTDTQTSSTMNESQHRIQIISDHLQRTDINDTELATSNTDLAKICNINKKSN